MHNPENLDAVFEAIVRLFPRTYDALRRELHLPPRSNGGSLKVRGGRRGRGNLRFAATRMSARIEDDCLLVEFEDANANRWELPRRSEKSEIRRIRNEAVAFAQDHGATIGQMNAVKKALTNAGFYISR